MYVDLIQQFHYVCILYPMCDASQNCDHSVTSSIRYGFLYMTNDTKI